MDNIPNLRIQRYKIFKDSKLGSILFSIHNCKMIFIFYLDNEIGPLFIVKNCLNNS